MIEQPKDSLKFDMAAPGEPSDIWYISAHLILDEESFPHVVEIFLGMGLSQYRLWKMFPGGHHDVTVIHRLRRAEK